MARADFTIGIVAPARSIPVETADKVRAYAFQHFGAGVELRFHPQCFLEQGHFAGSDEARGLALLEYANAPDIDAIWFARGGYGSMRLDLSIYDRLNEHARKKTYLGYSDMGAVLSMLYKRQIGRVVHGPMVADMARTGGEAAIDRALKFFIKGDRQGEEALARMPHPRMALNLTVLHHLMGTPYEPDFAGHVLLIEDVAEYEYAIDRKMFSLTANPALQALKGIAIGRFSAVPENEIPFGQTPEEIVRYWCHRSGIPFLGNADIGHDAENKIVVFGKG